MHPSRNLQFPFGSPDISRAAMPVYRTAPPLPLMFMRGKYSSGCRSGAWLVKVRSRAVSGSCRRQQQPLVRYLLQILQLYDM
eukprot:COSAG04_NODE_466_length_13930_cov_50.807968_6_plen_82_part_00